MIEALAFRARLDYHPIVDSLSAWLSDQEAISHALGVGALVAARIAPLTLFAPWFSLRRMPTLVRSTLVLALTVAFAPLAVHHTTVPEGALTMAAWLVREALIGTLFAVVTAMPFYALDWAGRMTDTWRGASLAEIIAPNTGERTSPVGDLYMLMGIAIFVTAGGHRLALGAFARGLESCPIGQADIAANAQSIALGAAELSGSALAFALAIAAPAAVAIIVVEVALGLLARSAPQVPVFFAGMPLRAAVGLGASLLALSLVVAQLPDAFQTAIDLASDWVGSLG